MNISEILFGLKTKSILRSIKKGNIEEIKSFVQNGGNVNEVHDDRSLLHFAIDNCEDNYYEAIELLINSGADINSTQSHTKETPLHRVCARIRPRMDVVKLLLERGADVNIENISGKTPIFHCNFSFSVELLELLLDYGADIKHTDKYKNTILHEDYVLCGDKYDFEEYLKFILSLGIDINSENNVGHTPVFLCKNKDISNILFEYSKKSELKS
jgi:ankyrin repeat protein